MTDHCDCCYCEIRNFVRQIVKGEFDCGGNVKDNEEFIFRQILKLTNKLCGGPHDRQK
jgi:hypothetical protein